MCAALWTSVSVGLSGTEFALQRRAEAWREPGRAEPVGKGGSLLFDRRTSVGADILQQADRDLAVRSVCPTAHDAAVDPHRRACVAIAVEQGGAMRTEVPVTLLPPHDGGVQRRQ